MWHLPCSASGATTTGSLGQLKGSGSEDVEKHGLFAWAPFVVIGNDVDVAIAGPERGGPSSSTDADVVDAGPERWGPSSSTSAAAAAALAAVAALGAIFYFSRCRGR